MQGRAGLRMRELLPPSLCQCLTLGCGAPTPMQQVIMLRRGRGALGLRVRDLLPPGMRWCLVSNYMIDIEYQLAEAPALLDDSLRLVIVHGDRNADRYNLPPGSLNFSRGMRVSHIRARSQGRWTPCMSSFPVQSKVVPC